MEPITQRARILLVAVLLCVLAPAVAWGQSSRYCYCKSGKVHTTDSCRVACAGDRETRTPDRAAKAKRARSSSGTTSMRYHRRSRPAPQKGVKNVSGGLPASMSGVVCVGGEVLRPKPPTQKARAFCARQSR